MGSVENPPLYALLAVLALMATFFSPSRPVAGIALGVSASGAIGAVAASLKHRSSAPGMVFLTCAASVAILLVACLLIYATFLVHWVF